MKFYVKTDDSAWPGLSPCHLYALHASYIGIIGEGQAKGFAGRGPQRGG